MKRGYKLLSLLLVLCLTLTILVACKDNNDDNQDGGGGAKETVDYVSQVKLDRNSGSLQEEVTVKSYIDGDTTHFNVSGKFAAAIGSDVLKARYLAINTPESTGKIEPWGHTASRFTKQKLQSAKSIILESDTAVANADSTGSRYLVWVWYQPETGAEYRNLNLEILQEGLAVASNSANNRYGSYCMSAIAQAQRLGLYVWSKDADPEIYTGDAIEVSLKELRTNIADYKDKTVKFEGVVTRNNGNNSVFIEEYDEETDLYYGIAVYYGFGFNRLNVLSIGNRVRIVGSCQYYENGGTYQVTDLKFAGPDVPKIVGEGEAAYTEVTGNTFANGKVSITETDADGKETTREFSWAELAMNTSVSMKGLTVTRIYTTTNEESASKGAMTITCKAPDGNTITLRTVVLKDADGNLVTEDMFKGKTLDIKGIVDYYDGDYQIKIYTLNDITIVG